MKQRIVIMDVVVDDFQGFIRVFKNMKQKYLLFNVYFFIMMLGFLGIGNSIERIEKSNNNTEFQKRQIKTADLQGQEKSKIKVTFLELGSVNCIPCKMMQPIIKNIEEKYKDQVKVIFYDVWTKEGRPYAEKYGIRLIPTQIFLDKDGKEYYRHQGFFPEEEIIKVLKVQGVQ